MRHCLPFCLVLLTVAGCSQLQQEGRDNSYIGWYCVDNPQTGIKDCEKRLMRAGQPISDKVYERLGEGRDAKLAREERIWSNKTPPAGSNPVTEVNTIEDANSFVVENQGPAPRPARAYKVWAEEGVGQSVAQPQTATRAKSAVTDRPPPKPAQTGYTIQLAAFKQDQQCQEYIQGFVGDKAPLSIRHIFSNGEPYCVITHGHYGSLDEANQAASMLLAKNSKVDTWVRSWASIKQAETPN